MTLKISEGQVKYKMHRLYTIFLALVFWRDIMKERTAGLGKQFKCNWLTSFDTYRTTAAHCSTFQMQTSLFNVQLDLWSIRYIALIFFNHWTMVYTQLGAHFEVSSPVDYFLFASSFKTNIRGERMVQQQWRKPLSGLSALRITFTWMSHQVFEVNSLYVISERLVHFKELEIQVKVILRTDDTHPSSPPWPRPPCWCCSSQSFGPYQSKVLTCLRHNSSGSWKNPSWLCIKHLNLLVRARAVSRSLLSAFRYFFFSWSGEWHISGALL